MLAAFAFPARGVCRESLNRIPVSAFQGRDNISANNNTNTPTHQHMRIITSNLQFHRHDAKSTHVLGEKWKPTRGRIGMVRKIKRLAARHIRREERALVALELAELSGADLGQATFDLI